MEQEITGRVESATLIKEGMSAKTGKPWHLYEVYINGQKFSAFDAAYVDSVGNEVTALFTLEQKGQYTNYTLRDLGAKPSVMSIVLKIQETVDEILEKVK